MQYTKEYFESKDKQYLESLDKRTQEYKAYQEYLMGDKPEDKNKSIVTTDIYNTVKEFNGRIKGDDLSWLFANYNKTFGTSLKKCLCAGKIKRMISKLRVTYERDNNIK